MTAETPVNGLGREDPDLALHATNAAPREQVPSVGGAMQWKETRARS